MIDLKARMKNMRHFDTNTSHSIIVKETFLKAFKMVSITNHNTYMKLCRNLFVIRYKRK